MGLNPFDTRAWVRTFQPQRTDDLNVLIPLIPGLGFERTREHLHSNRSVLIPLIPGLGFEPSVALCAIQTMGLNPFDTRAWVRTTRRRDLAEFIKVLIPLIPGLGFERRAYGIWPWLDSS